MQLKRKEPVGQACGQRQLRIPPPGGVLVKMTMVNFAAVFAAPRTAKEYLCGWVKGSLPGCRPVGQANPILERTLRYTCDHTKKPYRLQVENPVFCKGVAISGKNVSGIFHSTGAPPYCNTEVKSLPAEMERKAGGHNAPGLWVLFAFSKEQSAQAE